MSLHSCMNCAHFIAKGSVRCLMEQAPDVQDPGAGNRCAHFEFASVNEGAPAASREAVLGASESGGDDPAAARRRWAKLFGD